MELSWSLDELYTSFDSEAFKQDISKCTKFAHEIKQWVMENTADKERPKSKIEEFIDKMINFSSIISRLSGYAYLTQSVDAKNRKADKIIEELEKIASELAEPETVFQKWISSLEKLEDIIASSKLLSEHKFYLMEKVEQSKHMLSDKEEALIAKMESTGSNAWTRLQNLLTSTLLVDVVLDGEKKQIPLQAARNLAYDKDASVRKAAYEAELKSYEKIKDSSAACLNGIKGEVITLAEMRGYGSPLEKTLTDSRMDKETLDAMLTAIKEFLPCFHRYFSKKAELLGHSNGLPFYDLFAPIGKCDMVFTYDEAKDFIIRNFKTFSSKLSDFAANAFEKRWIDAEPKEGKRGGAFCYNLHVIKESRILTNFSGSFSDVTTLAHELGHGYHGHCLNQESILNCGYPMPLAETASNFCETIVKNAALNSASNEEALAILENDISDAGQVIVDIYSRYLFESEVFERRKTGPLSSDELCEIMIDSQKKAYGKGLDHNQLHPYLWVCKPHYYYAKRNFYNFPYAFGLLFAKGLYAEFLKRGSAFVEEYDKLLAATGKNNIADVAGMVGIDVRSTEYWRSSLKLIEQDIEKFLSLT